VGSAHGCALEGPAGEISKPQHLLAPPQFMAGTRGLAQYLEGLSLPTQRPWQDRMERVFHRRDVCLGKKRGSCVGKTKRGKGTKLMVVADGKGLPLGVSVHAASPAEVTLAQEALKTVRVRRRAGSSRTRPERLIGDKAYDSDKFRRQLRAMGIELIAPHRVNRRKKATQDGRALRRYCRRWKIERSIGWLGNYRRVVTRWDHNVHIFLAFVIIACLLITCRYL